MVKKQEIERIREQIAGAQARMEELETVIAGHTARKDAMAAEQKGFFAKREELTARLAELDKDMFRVQASQEKLEEKLEAPPATCGPNMR